MASFDSGSNSLSTASIRVTSPALLIILLGLLTAIGPLSIDMYLPAFHIIAGSLQATVAEVTWSLSSFFLGISFGQLLYGPLLERYGRKQPLYGGLLLYFIASLGCALSPSVEVLIVCRLFQALGGCVGMVAARAMVRDIFPPEQNARVFSLLLLVVSVSPILAPTLGGYITAWFGWRWVFGVLVGIVLLILAGTWLYLPESKPPDPDFSLRPGAIFNKFREVGQNRLFRRYALTGALSYAGLYAYVGGSPFVFMRLFNVTEQQFGWIFAFNAAGLIAASQLNSRLIRRWSGEKIIGIATLAQMLSGMTMVFLILMGMESLWNLIILLFVFLVCQGFIFPNATALALGPMALLAGTASALIGGVQMGVGAVASAAVGKLESDSALPMSGIMAACALLSGLYFHGSAMRKKDIPTGRQGF